MNNEFDYDIKRILKVAEREMLELNHPYVGSEHLLLSLLRIDSIKDILNSFNLTYDCFRNELISVVGKSNIKSNVVLYTPLLRLILDNALDIAKNSGKRLDEKILLSSLLTSDDGIAVRILMGMNIDIEGIYNCLINNNSSTLSDIGSNLNERKSEILIGRDKELNNMLKILLRKKKNNPVLIGNAGVGKSALVYELARRLKNNDVPVKLRNSKIISVDMATLLSNTKYRGEFETKLNNIIKELKSNKNIILFIDEIHTIVKSGGDNSIDAANILKPYLASDDIKIIGATTIYEYEKYIVPDKALSRRFESVYVSEPNNSEVINILKGVKKEYEDFHGVVITDKNILDIVKLSDKYIYNNSNPDKALDVLDYVCSKVKLDKYINNSDIKYKEFLRNKEYDKALNYRLDSKVKRIEYEDIVQTIEEIGNLKILKMEDYDKLVKDLDSKIYGQDLTKVKNILKRRFIFDKVIGFTIKGVDGIGKSFTAKVIADSLNYNLVELDMNDFSQSTSINKLIGVDPGYVGYNDKCFLDTIKYNSYSLILLKNIDNASYNVKEFFNKILKKGFIINNKGEKINFNNCLIIMTSNNVKSKLGYNEVNSSEENVIEYKMISKNIVNRYLKDKKIDLELIDKFKEYNTFNDINRTIEEFMYTNSISMI